MDLVEFAEKVRPLLEGAAGTLGIAYYVCRACESKAVRGCNCGFRGCPQGAHGIRGGRSGASAGERLQSEAALMLRAVTQAPAILLAARLP